MGRTTSAGTGSVLVQRGRYDSPFFRSKFRVPSPPRHFVHRPRLVRLLDDLSAYPVVALVAPAGAGKTALAADWIRSTGRRAAWLAIDEGDRDPRKLMTALAAAVDELAPGCAEAMMAVLRRPHGSTEAVLALVDVLEQAAASPAVLVIDDVHLVDEDPEAAAGLASFVEHKPAWLDLLLVGRRQLALPVHRLRAGGALADLSFEALRFSEDEALTMLTGLCPDAEPEELPDAAHWAGGWAAALQLAALAVRSRRISGLPHPRSGEEIPDGSGRLVDEYLWHEVLRAERPEMIDLLLAISVVDRVNFSLAEALVDRPRAGDLLSEAEARGLFVTALESGGWFEVHGLVRDLLAAELERRSPGRLRSYHARAALWFETVDDSTRALEHWLAADLPREALRLLADLAVDLVDGGRESALRRTIARITPTFPHADLGTLVEYAWCQLLVDRESFAVALAAAESAAAPEDDPDSRGRLMILQAAAALVSGSWRDCESLARHALDAMGERAWLDALGRFGWTLVAHGIALDERWSDGGPEVRRVWLGVTKDAPRATAFEGTRAVGLALAGQPLDAVRTAAGVRRTAEDGDLSSLRTELTLAEALAGREIGDGDQARQLLETLAAQPSYPQSFVQVLAQLELVEMHLSDGNIGEAAASFARATRSCEREPTGDRAATCLARRGVLLELARRDLEAAARWAQRVDDAFWGPVSDGRVHLAAHRRGEAVEALALAAPRSVRHQVVWHLLHARALRSDDRGAAEKEVATALELASDHGMLETVGTEGRDLLDLLELAAWRVPEGWMHRLRHVVVGGGDPTPAPGALVDALTARERDVLRLLPTRLTVREIASELFVSRNTVKFHLRVIYQKLGVTSRGEAVDRARSLGLLRAP
ncbi:MAG TPA: LuxR C-terminal-related transcriptional regulator [Nocardioides sp.]|uniref:LuxR C-terminal-related transcriptional regulator n=1 Tax=Nocardioides sp. TaxID=35761 RepID=UPI002CE0F4FC|nr:LuxR C-terminal-related transcriptional regulator [Nocardioides sp.]HTW14027.1 LuxR C-terminal-related transcriptional regulator [Nocardioides sp.]